MQRSVAGDIEIAFEWMAGPGKMRICGGNAVPVEVDSRDLDLFDLDQ